jgi:hypothetical protein
MQPGDNLGIAVSINVTPLGPLVSVVPIVTEVDDDERKEILISNFAGGIAELIGFLIASKVTPGLVMMAELILAINQGQDIDTIIQDNPVQEEPLPGPFADWKYGESDTPTDGFPP